MIMLTAIGKIRNFDLFIGILNFYGYEKEYNYLDCCCSCSYS